MLIVYICHMHGCGFCDETNEFYKQRWCCRMCKSVGSTKLRFGEILFHAFVDYYVNSIFLSKSAENT